MTVEQIQETIELLRVDKNYYGEFGSEFLSNSDINTLLNDPYQYRKRSQEDTAALLKGRYFHQSILEPEREEPIVISTETSRNSKAYKEEVQALGVDMLLLEKEVELLDPIIKRVRGSQFFMDRLRGDLQPGEIEEPAVGIIHGEWFKGKADRINSARGFVYDLKTTSDLSKFRTSFYRYGYNTQAYIYQELFGMPVEFLVVDLTTGSLACFGVSEQSLVEAEEKVLRAIQVKDLYFGAGGADINNHVNIQVL